MQQIRNMVLVGLFAIVVVVSAMLALSPGGNGFLLLALTCVFGGLLAIALMVNRKLLACPRCGAKITSTASAWFGIAEAVVCPVCGWDHDSKGRRTVPIRRR